ncbi:metal ABC transporter permease [bacterium]|nr:metal ABC transporter permease [bacterium]
MNPQIEIMIIASIVSTACVLPGVFLVLRKVALMSDAISHSILMGIVVMFFIVGNLHSPLLMIGAVATGIATVAITESLIQSRRLKEDAAIGLVFPVFFSIGVILISRYAGNIHLDQDAVLLGELAFAPFNRVILFNRDFGPLALWTMGGILITNATLIGVFYKELKLSTFDKALATTLGFSPVIIYYGLMTMVSITAVGAFDAVGSILVVALMITPPSTAYLLTDRLSRMLGLSVIFGIASSITGYGMATLLDASIAGSIATMTGVFFLIALFFSPKQGFAIVYFRAKRQQVDFAIKMLLVQLLAHEDRADAFEMTVKHMVQHMDWDSRFADKIAQSAVLKGFVLRDRTRLTLTPLGREMAREALIR